MKLILSGLTALVLTLAACNAKKESSAVIIDYSQPIVSDADFIFSTCQGKTMIMASASTAQKISNGLKEQTGATLPAMGIGNAFTLNIGGKPFLCTARHGAVGLEKFTRNIGADIAIVDFNAIPHEKIGGIQLTTAYDIDTSIHMTDSVFIKGYLFDKQGELQSVIIRGLARRLSKSQYAADDMLNNSNTQYVQENALIIKLDENIELAGLSGAPAFNSQGKVIGVYSGRIVEQGDGKDKYSIRISLFN